jgi:murein DD-endopeptidase MepM/ murein hydrolase activator NlpD
MALTSSFDLTKINSTATKARKGLAQSEKTIKLINTSIFKRTKVKRESFASIKMFRDRRVEYDRRKEQEDELEAPTTLVRTDGPSQLVQSDTSKGFFERIIGFMGYVTAGWMLRNLPTWIDMGNKLVMRIRKAGQIIFEAVNSIQTIFEGFGGILNSYYQNLLQFNFSGNEKEIDNSMNQLNSGFLDFQSKVEEAFGALVAPFEKGGSEPSTGANEGAYVQPEPYTGSSYTGTSYESAGGQKITKSEFGSRGFRTRDGLGSGASAFGHTGRDVPMPTGTPLSLVSPGVVVEASYGHNGGFGNLVVVKLDDGRYIKINHLSKILVREGDRVGAGSGKNGGVKVLGLVGSTGLSTGPHMHLDVGTGYSRGSADITGLMDPDPFILGGGVVKGGDVKSTGQTTSTTPTTTPNKPGAQPQQTLMGQPSGGQPIPSGGTLSASQLVALAKQVGMDQQVNVRGYSGPLSVLMAAVGMQESRGRSTAMRPDTEVYGLWQIRWPVHAANLRKIGITSPQQLYDPLLNAKAAKMVYDRQGITAWSAFTDGNYKKFLPEAQKASGIAPGQFTAAQTGQPSQDISSSITPDQTPKDIMVYSPGNQETIITPSGGGASSPGTSPVSEFQLLNNFIKNKLLLDLAYL